MRPAKPRLFLLLNPRPFADTAACVRTGFEPRQTAALTLVLLQLRDARDVLGSWHVVAPNPLPLRLVFWLLVGCASLSLCVFCVCADVFALPLSPPLAGSMAWDMDDMGSVMMIPVVFCLHIVLICLGTFTGA